MPTWLGRDDLGRMVDITIDESTVTSDPVAGDEVLNAGGGGALTVTGALSGAVASATEIIMPGAVVESSPGVATVGLVVEQIGPFAVAFNSANIYATTGRTLVTLDAGTLILRAWIFIGPDAPWNPVAPGTTASMNVRVRDAADLTNSAVVASAPDITFSDNFAGYFVSVEQSDSPLSYHIARIDGPAVLSARVIVTGSASCDAGTADVYAIIATPAA